MKRRVIFKQSICPAKSVIIKGVFIFLLFVSLAFRSVGAPVLIPNVEQSPDSTGNTLVIEQLLQEYGTDETRSVPEWPPIWDVPQTNSNFTPHFILVMLSANPRINDIPISQNDYIGGFYTDDEGELRCGGADIWVDTINIVVKLFADDENTDEKDGFSYGEQIYFKFFLWSTQNDYDVDVVEFNTSGLYLSTDKWYPLGASQVVDMQALVDMDFYISASANPICIGTQLFLTGEEFIGTGGPYTFDWNSDPPGFVSSLQIPPPVTPLETTTYFLTVEDGVFTAESLLTINVIDPPEAHAGDDGLVCANELFSLNGMATNFDNIQWTSSGDGTFDYDTSLMAIYSPGGQDMTNGSIIITLAANPINPCVLVATDEMELQVLALPEVDAGEDIYACNDDPVVLEALGQNYDAVIWTSFGDGEFSDPNSLLTEYYPGENDIADGVSLEVCVDAMSPCVANDCDTVHLSYVVPPTCNAPSSRTKCENVPVPMAGSAANNDGIMWTTVGDGHFVDSSDINTDYIAGPQDRHIGATVVTLNALPYASCSDTAKKDVNIILKPLPDVDAGNTNYICNATSILLNASVEDEQNFFWTTLGDGSFSSTTSLTPVYSLGPGDISNAAFELVLTGTPISPCTLSISDTLPIEVIDNPIVDIVTQNNQVVCESDEFVLNANSIFYDEIIWQTTGDGFFSHPDSLNTIYIPGTSDILSGQTVMLTIAVLPIAPCDLSDASSIHVLFKPNPTINAGNDEDICETEIIQLQGSVEHESGILWQTDGDGLFSDETIPDPIYTPGGNDKITGSVVLTINAFANSPCVTTATDELVVNIQLEPVIDAGIDATICEIAIHPLEGVTAENYAQLLWTTSGNGVFSNPNIENPVYTPGSQDKLNGTATLTLRGFAINPCTVFKDDIKILTVINLPLADAGDDIEICETANVLLQGSVEHALSILWQTSGDGLFSNATISDPVYTPGDNDKISGAVLLTINAFAIGPCETNASDELVLNIQLEPVINAGNDATICESSTHSLVGVTAESFAQLLWTTSGDGEFNNPNIKNPVYTPGSQDKSNGSAILTFTGFAINPCAVNKEDEIVLTVIQLPFVNAGDDAEICETGSYLLNAIAENYSSLLWESDGDGLFNNNSIPNPEYTPGSIDKSSGLVTLTLLASAINPCSVNDSDEITLNIQLEPVIIAGSDATICETETHYLGGSTAENYSQLNWTSSGDGEFNFTNIKNPVYTPGSQDKLDGTATLTLSGSAINPCVVALENELTLSIQAEPVIIAGNDATICVTSLYFLAGVTAHNYSGLEWASSGDGTFNNVNIKNPVYFPGPQDKLEGLITFTLTGYAINPCTVLKEDQKNLTMIKLPVASAGDDITACGETELSGTVSNFSSLLWATAGDGSFSNPSIPNPIYYPGSGDIANLSVVLTISAQSISPCSGSANDIMIYSFDMPQVISDGVTDTELFAGNTLQFEFLSQSVTTGEYVWYFNGETIEGQNSSLLSISDMKPDNAGYYKCMYSNDCGVVESYEALVQILDNSIQQSILSKGWSGISSYVMPNDPVMEDVFSAVVDDLILVSDNTGVYWPAQNINTLNDWSVTTGYRIKMENNVGFNMSGYIRYPSQELTIPTGWSYLPVNAICAVDIETVFNSMPDISMIKDIAETGIYWPEFNVNTLQMLYPGNAYHILNIGSPAILQYPECDTPIFEFKKEIIEVQNPWNEITRTPSSHVFGFAASILSQFEQGDIIGVFTREGYCAGVLEIDHQSDSQALVAFANDALTNVKDGFDSGEFVAFKIFRNSSVEEMYVDVSFEPRLVNSGLFVLNGVSIIESLEFKTSSVSGLALGDIQLHIYPNPTSGQVYVEFLTDHQISGEISVNAINGQLVYAADFGSSEFGAKLSVDLSELIRGIYYLRITSDQFTQTEKIVLE